MMELEYKWKANRQDFDKLLIKLSIMVVYPQKMYSEYFDTAHNYLASKKAGLRLRKEDEKSICALKITVDEADGLSNKHEYETEAFDIYDGFNILSQNEEITILSSLCANDLNKICSMSFTRLNAKVEAKSFTAVLSYDEGEFYNSGIIQPFSELECEFIDGKSDAFLDFCEKIQKDMNLTPLKQSKLKRCKSII